MDLTVSNSLTGSLSALIQGRIAKPYQAAAKPDTTSTASLTPKTPESPAGTKVIFESREDLDNGGYRLTRSFQQEDGRIFSKVEEFALTGRGSKKTVVQQNPSGSITRYEDVIDRESNGSFRRTQRFEDATGEVATNITPDFKTTDPFALIGNFATNSSSNNAAFAPYRGTQLDLQA